MDAERLSDPLRAGQELFDVFPEDSLPRQYLQWSRKAFGSPHVYHVAAILVCLAHELDSRGFYLARGIDRGRIPLTLWFLMLGGSASGKSTIIHAAQDFWRDVRKAANVHREDPWIEPEGSPQGLVVALQELYDAQHDQTSAIFVQTEGAKIFNTREAVAEMLCKIYDGRTFQSNYRRNQKGGNPFVRNPHVSLLVASTEEQLAPHFKDQHRNGGIFTRFCWLNPKFTKADIRLPADHAGATTINDLRDKAVDTGGFWFAQLSVLRKLKRVDGAFALTPQAHELLETDLFEPFKDAFEDGDGDNMHGVRMRLIEKTKVMGAIFASLRNSMSVKPEDIERAIAITKILLAHAKSVSGFGSSEIHRHAVKLEHVIKAAGDKGVSRRVLYRHVRIDKRMMDQVIDTLLDRGVVHECFDRSRAGSFVHATSDRGQAIQEQQQERRTTNTLAERLQHRRSFS